MRLPLFCSIIHKKQARNNCYPSPAPYTLYLKNYRIFFLMNHFYNFIMLIHHCHFRGMCF